MHTLFAIILSLLICCPASASTAEPINDVYQARMTVTIEKHSATTNLWAKPGLMRVSMLGGRAFNTAITDYKQKKSWALSTSHMVYQEFPSSQLRSFVPEFFNPELEITKELIGTEEINGVKAKKYQTTVKFPGKADQTGFLWEALDLPGYPLKWQEPTRQVEALWKNAKLVNKPRSFFQVPSDYREQKAQQQTLNKGEGCNKPSRATAGQ